MSKRIMIQIIAWFLFLLWITLATFLSSQNGANTSETSLRLIRFFAKHVPFVQQHESLCNTILRKMAHVFIFAFLCGFLYFGLFATSRNIKLAYAGAVSFSIVYALFDEVKKLFISGRHLHWADVGMNVVGVLIGIVILYFLSSHFNHYAKD